MKLKRLLRMQASMALAIGIGWALIVPYFLSLGFGETDILLYFLAFFATPLATLRITRNWRIRNYLTFGLATRGLCFLLAMWIVHPLQLVLIGMVFSFIMTDYWVVYNTLVEDGTSSGNRAYTNSIVMAVLPIASMFTPIVAGYVADQHGFFWMLFLASLFMIVPIWLSRKESGQRMLFDLKRARHNNPRVREILVLEGFGAAAGWVVPLFVTLQFVSSNTEFGGFFSYLGLVGVVGSLALGKMSDKSEKRAKYLAPVMIVNGLALVMAGLAGSLLPWVIGLSLYSLFLRIEWPFTWAVVTDSAKVIGDAMIMREYWLNMGRVLFMLVLLAAMHFNMNMQMGMALGGVGYFLFPLFMKIRKLG